MNVDERITAELRSHAPEVDELGAWDRIQSAAPIHRRSRAIRLVAISIAAAGFLLVGSILVSTLNSGPPPASGPQSPFLGTWGTTAYDGGTTTMIIEASEEGTVGIEVHDDSASPCLGGPSTMTGTGRLEGTTTMIVPSPVLTCDDGRQPDGFEQPILEDGTTVLIPLELLQNLTFTHDAGTDILSDNFGWVWTRKAANPSPEPTTPPPSESELTELLNGFLDARIAGEGAEQFLNFPQEDILLLYATTSGTPYDRGEFEQVSGYEWPYGLAAVKVRMFAGDTVVEQLFFKSTGRRLTYQPDGFATDIPPTAENGQPVAWLPFDVFDGEVTLHFAHPWISTAAEFLRMIPEGPGVAPTTDGGERNSWDTLSIAADPAPTGPDCQAGPATAEGLAESIRSDLDISAPVVVSGEALIIDVVNDADAMTVLQHICDLGVLRLRFDSPGVEQHERLYLLDAPEGSSMRILAIALVAAESKFERAAEALGPVIDAVEFHSP